MESVEGVAIFSIFLSLVGVGCGLFTFYHWYAGNGAYDEERYKNKIRNQIQDLRDITSDLEEDARSRHRGFYPGNARRARDSLMLEMHNAFRTTSQEDSLGKKKPDANSEDPIERMAAKFKDPNLREDLRAMWDKEYSWEQEKAREIVKTKMGVFGIKWPEKGNPFD